MNGEGLGGRVMVGLVYFFFMNFCKADNGTACESPSASRFERLLAVSTGHDNVLHIYWLAKNENELPV